MESARVRGCVVQTPRASKAPGRQADASRRRNGPRKAARVQALPAPGPSRSRCGLEVSPAPAPPSDTACHREKGSSGGEAANPSAGDCGVEDQVGRAGSISPGSVHVPGPRTRVAACLVEAHAGVTPRNQLFNGRFTWKSRSQVDIASCRTVRSHVEEKLAKLEKHDHRIIRVAGRGGVRAQPPPERPRRPGRADRASPRGRWCGPRPRPTTRWRPSTSRWTRWPRRCARPPTDDGSTTAGTPRCRWGRRSPDQPVASNGADERRRPS